MTIRNRKKRNGNSGGSWMPPHFVIESERQVVFHIKGGFPVTMGIPNWMKSFPEGYKGVVDRCEETFYKLREKGMK